MIRGEDIQFGGPYYRPTDDKISEEEEGFESELFAEDPFISEHYGEITPYGVTGKPEILPAIRNREGLFGGQTGTATGFMPERETGEGGRGFNYAGLGGTALTTGASVLKSVVGGKGVEGVLSDLPYGAVLSNLINLFGGEGNAAASYMAGNLGGLAKQYFSGMAGQGVGLFSEGAQGALTGMGAVGGGVSGLTEFVNPLGQMMAGQTDFTNPYSGYLSMLPLPLLNTILGGFLEGVIGGKDPMKGEPISLDWLATLQRKQMDPRWGTQGAWNWRLKGGPGSPVEADKDLTFKRPTNPEDLQWYQRHYAPYAAQFASPYGLLSTMATGEMGEGSWQPPKDSPLAEWWDILKERDKRSGLRDQMSIYGKYYTVGSMPTGQATTEGRIPYAGVNPFANLTTGQVKFFYDEVLPYIDEILSQGGWYGHEGLSSMAQSNEASMGGLPEPAITRRLT